MRVRIKPAYLAAIAAVAAIGGIGVTLVMNREPAAQAGPAISRMISQSQYVAAIKSVFGADVGSDVRFPPVKRTGGLLAVGTAAAAMTPGAFELFETSARTIAQQVTDDAHRDFLLPCRPDDPAAFDRVCAETFLARAGRLLYRRPLSGDELKRMLDVGDATVARSHDFYAGLAASLTGMLASPKFVQLTEKVETVDGVARLDGFSKATRLSLFLWNAVPDDTLIAAAERGELSAAKGVAAQVDRMLASPKLADGVRAFFADMYGFDAFENLSKDPVIYPVYTRIIAQLAQEQMLRTVVDHVVARRADYRDLFTTRRTFLNGPLGVLYGVALPYAPAGWTPYEFPTDDLRAGLLTQVGFLSVYAHAGRSSPTKRGRALRESFLCQKVPDPPPNVDFSIVEDPRANFKTARERLTAHSNDATCAGCHKITDPIGLALENFDGAGQYRKDEKGAPIDASGAMGAVKFTDAAGLGAAIHDDPALTSCLVSRLASYATGREMNRADNDWLAYMRGRFANHGYDVTALIREIALSEGFFAVAPESGDDRPADQKTAAN